MKYEDINKKFTETLTVWLAKGYYINTATMRGSQGEMGKVDLTNGKEIVRVLLGRFTERIVDGGLEGIELRVGRDTRGQKPNTDDGYDTIWNNDLEVLSSEKFYLIGSDHHRNNWYGTKDEARKASMVRYERWKNVPENPINRVFGAKAGAIVLPKVRAQRGLKKAEADAIKVEKNFYESTGEVLYTATYSGRTIKLA